MLSLIYRKLVLAGPQGGKVDRMLLVGRDGTWRGWRRVKSVSPPAADEAMTEGCESGKVTTTKNYVVEGRRSPAKKEVRRYRRKVIYDQEGKKHVATIAVLKNGRTKLVSLWHPKKEKTSSSAEVRKRLQR